MSANPSHRPITLLIGTWAALLNATAVRGVPATAAVGEPHAEAPASITTRPATVPATRPTTQPLVLSGPAAIDGAIERAKAYLYSQLRLGNWEEEQQKEPWDPLFEFGMGGRGRNPETSSQWGGRTAMIAFSLLAAGESVRDPRLTKAIQFLAASEITGTYALAMRAQIWSYLPVNNEIHSRTQQDAGALFRGAERGAQTRGLYRYTPKDNDYDLSASQFGVLGMWGCEQAGLEIPEKYWSDVQKAWLRHQDASGGWNYRGIPADPDGPEMNRSKPGRDNNRPPGGPGGRGPMEMRDPMWAQRVSISMTAAGVATLLITQDHLQTDAVPCKGNYINPAVNAGLAWITQHYSELPADPHYYYTLFGISRIGLASGQKYLGTRDWYKEGAKQLVDAQSPDGSWSGTQITHGLTDKGATLTDTAFGLLFLARSRAPVAINKMEYSIQHAGKSEPGNWNQRGRDAANITRWIGRQIERPLNWQSVNLEAPAEELRDAPILYIAGNQALSFTDAQEAKLRTFVEQGGLIVGNADCGSKLFSDSFQALGARLFNYEFRKLPANHPIYINELEQLKSPPAIVGLSNGSRELMLLIPTADPARSWQTRAALSHEDMHRIMADIYLYAVDKKYMRFKGDGIVATPDLAITAKRTIKLARLEYAGNWNPEPGGWRQLAAVMHNQLATDLVVEPITLGEGKLAAYRIAHLTGTFKLHFTDPQRDELKHFVEAGGTLIIDGAGGAGEFDAAIEEELTTIFGFDACKHIHHPLPPDHAIYCGLGEPLGRIAYRQFARKFFAGALDIPRLGAVFIGDRPAVVYSPDDLSTGLVGEPVDGILGYEPESATRLMSTILIYVAGK